MPPVGRGAAELAPNPGRAYVLRGWNPGEPTFTRGWRLYSAGTVADL